MNRKSREVRGRVSRVRGFSHFQSPERVCSPSKMSLLLQVCWCLQRQEAFRNGEHLVRWLMLLPGDKNLTISLNSEESNHAKHRGQRIAQQDWKRGLHLKSRGLRECHAFLGRIPGRDGCRLPYPTDQPSSAFTGNFEVGVHIADVSYFVPEGSPLDKVAAERATSVYLVQKVSTGLQFLGLKKRSI